MKNSQPPLEAFASGRPIEAVESDRLGHWPLAKILARAIRDRSPTSGFVVGIEGEWGSGKSSIANLLKIALSEDPRARHRVVRFNPWIVGSRDQLLGELFADLIRAAADLEAASAARWWHVREQWLAFRQWRRLRKLKAGHRKWFLLFGEFAARLGQLGPVATALGALEPTTGAATALSNAIAQFAKSRRPKSLLEIKSAIDVALSSLSGRLVVLIDDLDRLEPAESVEVLRLIRAVADFNNVTYVLCYDREVLAKALETELEIKSGTDFLEKVVQLPIRLPQPEAFRLRHWFAELLSQLFSIELQHLQSSENREPLDRFASALDVYGGKYLKTPRHMYLTLNSLSLQVPALAGLTDFADLLIINFLRHGNPKLFRWVEEYLTEVAALANGAGLSGRDKERSAEKLAEIFSDGGTDVDRDLIEFSNLIPGIHHEFIPNKRWVTFENISRRTLAPLIRAKRLGSPDHYRHYFAYSNPESSLSDSEIDLFSKLLRTDLPAAKIAFAEAATTTMSGGNALRAERLLDQILVRERLDEIQLAGLIECISDTLDDAGRTLSLPLLGAPIWRQAISILQQEFPKLGPIVGPRVRREILRNGRAIGFLAEFFRREASAHGGPDSSVEPKPDSQWIFAADEFEEAKTILSNRFLSLSPAELLNTPEPLSLLYGWKEIGGLSDAKLAVERIVATDSGLLRFLDACRGWSNRSDRKGSSLVRPLRRRELAPFLDVSQAESRLSLIAQNKEFSADERTQATRLLDALRLGDGL